MANDARDRAIARFLGSAELQQRFFSQVNRKHEDGCWLWEGASVRSTGRSNRYGVLRFKPDRIRAHIAAYVLGVGPIPDGLVLDHVCRETLCVNPAHLEAVTNAENVLRGVGVTARNKLKTSCINGHPFDVQNTHFRRNGDRECRACKQAYKRRIRISNNIAAAIRETPR